MPLFYQPLITSGNHFLDAEESRHCIKVLRLRNGDNIQVLDGNGYLYTAKITNDSPKQCGFEIMETAFFEKPPFHIHIAIAPTKNTDRMEWFVEKAVEIGIQQISFMVCENSERKVLKTERLERKAISAMKQSQQVYLPQIKVLEPFEKIVTHTQTDRKYIAHVDFENPLRLSQADPGLSYCVLIGPEGDFTPAELDLAFRHGFKKVSLGPSRLRTETAALVACHLLNLVNQG